MEPLLPQRGPSEGRRSWVSWAVAMAAEGLRVPVWLWPPGATEPVEAAGITSTAGDSRWLFTDSYLAHEHAISPDPLQLRLRSSRKGTALLEMDGLPGVVRDAMPAGYGADRLDAAANKKLTPLELLAFGVADACGALEVCRDVQRKLDWVPHDFSKLKDILVLMRADEPARRAARLLNDDASTSAGGERPKVTIQDKGRMYLVKMQARPDVEFLPHKEFVVMSMASACGIRTPAVRLESVGEHALYLCESETLTTTRETTACCSKKVTGGWHPLLTSPPSPTSGTGCRWPQASMARPPSAQNACSPRVSALALPLKTPPHGWPKPVPAWPTAGNLRCARSA